MGLKGMKRGRAEWGSRYGTGSLAWKLAADETGHRKSVEGRRRLPSVGGPQVGWGKGGTGMPGSLREGSGREENERERGLSNAGRKDDAYCERLSASCRTGRLRRPGESSQRKDKAEKRTKRRGGTAISKRKETIIRRKEPPTIRKGRKE